jgi:hypothetical protein
MRPDHEAKGDCQHEKHDDGRDRHHPRQPLLRTSAPIASKDPAVNDRRATAEQPAQGVTDEHHRQPDRIPLDLAKHASGG